MIHFIIHIKRQSLVIIIVIVIVMPLIWQWIISILIINGDFKGGLVISTKKKKLSFVSGDQRQRRLIWFSIKQPTINQVLIISSQWNAVTLSIWIITSIIRTVFGLQPLSMIWITKLMLTVFIIVVRHFKIHVTRILLPLRQTVDVPLFWPQNT